MSNIDSEELEALRQSLRQFLAREAPPEQLRQWEADHAIPRSFLENLAGLGVCGLVVPEEYGGLGLEITAMTTVIRELARHSMGLAGFYIMNAGYAGLNLAFSGTDEQKSRFLPLVTEGKLMFSLGLSEPDVGADLASVKTRAERRGDTVVVNGMKRWCSASEITDYIYALVRTGAAEDRHRNLTFILVPPRAKGVSMTPVHTMGSRSYGHNDVAFDNVQVPFDNVIGGEDAWNNGWAKLAGPTLEIEKLMPSSMAVGLGEAIVAEAWQYAQERRQFGKRICGHQAIRHSLSDAQTKLQACRLMLDNAALLVHQRQPSAVQTSMTKLFVAETVRDIAIACQQVMGAYGYSDGFNMERYVRDALALPILGGSSAIQRNNIANLMRLPKE